MVLRSKFQVIKQIINYMQLNGSSLQISSDKANYKLYALFLHHVGKETRLYFKSNMN
jgi:hypothetical protein